jgi:hypothetical protein
MKAFNFGANVATIGGKKVPYSLLGAAAAILGAVLIWMQFRNNGGISLGGASPDLSGLTDATGGGGGGGVDLSGAVPDLGPLPSSPGYYSTPIPVFGLGAAQPSNGPAYAAAMPAPATGSTVSDILPSSGGPNTGFTSGGYVAPRSSPGGALTSLAPYLTKSAGTIKSSAPGFTAAARSAPKPAPAPAPAPSGGLGGGSFTF